MHEYNICTNIYIYTHNYIAHSLNSIMLFLFAGFDDLCDDEDVT